MVLHGVAGILTKGGRRDEDWMGRGSALDNQRERGGAARRATCFSWLVTRALASPGSSAPAPAPAPAHLTDADSPGTGRVLSGTGGGRSGGGHCGSTLLRCLPSSISRDLEEQEQGPRPASASGQVLHHGTFLASGATHAYHGPASDRPDGTLPLLLRTTTIFSPLPSSLLAHMARTMTGRRRCVVT